MTTIAFKDGIMAADSAITGDGVLWGYSDKIFKRTDSKFVIGVSGPVENISRIQNWCDTQSSIGSLDSISLSDNVDLLIVDCNTQQLYLFQNGVVFGFNQPIMAIGTGREFALGAMAAGATAEQAVEIARYYDNNTSGPIKTLPTSYTSKTKKSKTPDSFVDSTGTVFQAIDNIPGSIFPVKE